MSDFHDDIYQFRDSFVKAVDEWDVWDMLRCYYQGYKIPDNVQKDVFYSIQSMRPLNFVAFNMDQIYDSIKSRIEHGCFRLDDYNEYSYLDILKAVDLSRYRMLEEIIWIEYDETHNRFVLLSTDFDLAYDIEYEMQGIVKQMYFANCLDAYNSFLMMYCDSYDTYIQELQHTEKAYIGYLESDSQVLFKVDMVTFGIIYGILIYCLVYLLLYNS